MSQTTVSKMDGADYFQLSNGIASIDQLIARYAGPDGLVKVDLGSGYYKPEGYIGFDNMSETKIQIENASNMPDVLMDLNTHAIPLPDISCSEVRSSHFLEHSNLDHIFREAYRVLVPGGVFKFTVPYANSADGMYPGHHMFLTEKWFEKNVTFQSLFEITNRQFKRSPEYEAAPWWIKLIFPFYVARTLLFNACNEMTISAVKRSSPPKTRKRSALHQRIREEAAHGPR